MLTLKIIIFGLIFIASGGAAFSHLFRDKVWMQVVVGVVGSLSLIFMIREIVRDEMRKMLDLLRPIYTQTAAYGHFGREEPDFTWEKTDKAQILREAAKI